MAKSLRSKWKRKMRAVKRVRYGEKERARLEKMLDTYKQEQEEMKREQQESDLKHEPQILGESSAKVDNESVAMDQTSEERAKFSSKTLRNEHGSYPVWLSNRRIQQQKAKAKGNKRHAEGKVVKSNKKKNKNKLL